MLEKIRQPGRGKAILAYVIFGAICLVFVFLGMTPQGTGFVSGGAAAIVNDKIISQKDYRERVRRAEASMGFNLSQLPAANRKMFTAQIRQRALEDLIQMELMAQAALSEGLVTSDAEVRDFIMEIPVFSDQGRFQRVRYDTYLKNIQMTHGQFENMIRRDLSRQRVRDVFVKALVPAEFSVEKDKMAQNTKLNISFVSFRKDDLLLKLKPSASEVKKFAGSDEGSQKISDYYENNKGEYSSPKQVQVSHILIEAKKGDASAEEAALKKVRKLRARAEKEDFATLAKENSQDKFSASKGGDLGWLKPGDMQKEFESVAFALNPGEISAPIQTSVGYHIAKVHAKKEKVQKSLDEVKMEIAKKVVGESLFQKELDRAAKVLAEGQEPKSFIKRFKLKWDETGEFALSGSTPKLSDEKVVNDVLAFGKTNQVVDRFVESNGVYYVARLDAVKWPQESDSKGAEFLARRRAGDALGQWLKSIEKGAKIQRNPALLQQ